MPQSHSSALLVGSGDGGEASTKAHDARKYLDTASRSFSGQRYHPALRSLLKTISGSSNYEYDADTPQGGVRNHIIDPDITVTVPPGKAYYYQVTYNGGIFYVFGNRRNSSSSFYAAWGTALLADDTQVGIPVEVAETGYRQDWNALASSSIWAAPLHATWLIRLEEGTHDLKIDFHGYSDNTMNKVGVRAQSLQVMRLY